MKVCIHIHVNVEGVVWEGGGIEEAKKGIELSQGVVTDFYSKEKNCAISMSLY